MDEIYKFSSTERVQQVEKELAAQLAELKTEIEGNGVLQGTPNCSVRLPKDIDYFRRERELALKKCLQVAEAKPLVIQADVLQRELESCLKREYTPESLPLLLHQFFTDRITQLVQSKYLHMLRWKRFCQHSSVIEQLYPFYQKQVAHIMQEYNDAVQRAARLSSAQENFLTGKENPTNLVTQEDLTIYTQWLICHLHSLKAVHNYLQVLQYLPISQRTEVAVDRQPSCNDGDAVKTLSKTEFLSPNIQLFVWPSTSVPDGALSEDATFALPQHSTETEELKPQLRLLLSQFGIDYDVENLRHSANEMELFSMVMQKFRSIFSKQQTMRTFPVYDVGNPGSENWGMVDSKMALKKKANWIPFIKIKAKQDPWQQKQLIKLKQWKKVDEMLLVQSQFLKVSSLEWVMEALQKQAAAALEPKSVTSVFMTSFNSQQYDQIWDKIYHNPEFHQEQQTNGDDDNSVLATVERGLENSYLKEGSAFSRKKKDTSHTTTLQLLGLDEDMDASDKDFVPRKGAYVSFIYLRHLRIRELQVHSVQFMEFAEVENHDDFYTVEDMYIHTQDQRGFFVIYDVALQDLKELERQLLLVATQYIEREKGHKACCDSNNSNYSGWAHASVDRSTVLLDLWTCETGFLENKRQLLDCYFEAYQHALALEERFALAQVITDVMYRRPQFDFHLGYFVNIYKDECACLRLQTQLVRDILNQQIDNQRDYNHKIWHDGPKGGIHEFGFPPYIVPKQLIAVNNSPTALKNIYLLEFHPSLGLVSLIPKALSHVLQEFRQICRPKTAKEAIKLDKQVLQLALDAWLTLENPRSFYGSQTQKDLFTEVLIEDPSLVKEIAVSALKSVIKAEQNKGNKEKQISILSIFSRLLELLVLRYRLIEAAVESAQMGRLYKEFAGEMGFDEFHLYLRPVYFEFATHKEKADQPASVFITSLLDHQDGSVDRYIPSTLMLNIQDIDNQIGKFSFRTRDSILQILLNPYGVENLQIALACQVTHKNTLLVAIQQAAFCPMMQPIRTVDMKEGALSQRSQSSSVSGSSSTIGNELEDQSLATTPLSSYFTGRFIAGRCNLRRYPEAFVSIQLEKQGPRDMMLNAFIQKKQTLGSRMQNTDEAEKIKREVIVEYCHKMNHRISQYSLRSQIIAYYNSIRAMLNDFPSVRAKYFIVGLPQEKKGERESKAKLGDDPRSFQPRPRCLLSSDGRSFLNLWFIPHPSEVLFLFRMLPEKTGYRALKQTLEIVAAFHDIIAYIFSFVQLGNPPECFDYLCPSDYLSADWGGTEWIGNELQELQRKIDCLHNPTDPKKVAQMLSMHRELLFLQFDAAVRHSMREAFLSSGNVCAYQSITDNLYHGLPPLSNAIVGSLLASQLPLPKPLDQHGLRAQMLFPWRTFLANTGPFPVTIDNLNPINYSMQLCLCGLNDEDRKTVHGELIGMQFILEDVFWSNYETLNDLRSQQTSFKKPDSAMIAEGSRKASEVPLELRDSAAACATQKSYLILWKQLEMLKAEWGRLKLKVEDINTVTLYKQFSELYDVEVLYPAMSSLARYRGIEDKFEGFGATSQSILPPKEASEVEIKTYQVQKLLECLEIHMIHDVQKKVNKEITLVISEKAREERNLPTELWKHHSMQEVFSVTRPEIVESFIQRLMENHQETKAEIAFQKDHLQKCLTALGCDVMARERSNFETYSMFYENILHQQHQLLYQKEQETEAMKVKGGDAELGLSQVAEMSHEMVMEITALRAKTADLQEEGHSFREKIRKEVKEDYEALVQSMFMMCVQLKGKVDEYRLNLSQHMFEIISEVRREGVDKMVALKKKFGSTKDNNALRKHLAQEQLQELQNENNQLQQLVLKLKTMNYWKETMQKAQLSARVREAEKEAIKNKKEYLKLKMMTEKEAILFHQQLGAARKALAQSQTENKKLKQQLDKQVQVLQEVEHKMNQEVCRWQHLDLIKTENLEKMLEKLGERELRLQCLTEEAEKSNKIQQLQEGKVKKEIQQIRSQLALERNFKLNAFQRVDELQSQLYDLEALASQRHSSAEMRRKPANLSRSASSTFSGTALGSQSTRLSPFVLTRDSRHNLLTAESMDRSKLEKISRPKTVPSRGRNSVIDALLPDLRENDTLIYGEKISQK